MTPDESYQAGIREGLRQSTQLGVSVLVQQLRDVIEKLERISERLDAAEIERRGYEWAMSNANAEEHALLERDADDDTDA